MALGVWQSRSGEPRWTSSETDQLSDHLELLRGAVRISWIQKMLEEPLSRQPFIDLELRQQFSPKAHPSDNLGDHPQRSQPAPKDDADLVVLLEKHRSLLITGIAGAGKTTALVTMAKRLLETTEIDPTKPVPVVFRLASWAVNRKPLQEWLVDELAGEMYGVRRGVAEALIGGTRVLPLLDGLDEVAPQYRAECAKEIERFHKEHGLLVAVCSRPIAAASLLNVRVTVELQPLTRRQLEDYLDQFGAPLAGVREALTIDPVLWELLRIPFLLSMAITAYQGVAAPEIATGTSLEEQRDRLFTEFVAKALHRKSHVPGAPKPADANRWLGYLARGLAQRFQQTFHLDLIRTDWLPGRSMRRWAMVGAAVPGALLVAVASAATTGLALGGTAGRIIGTIFGVLFGVWLSFAPVELSELQASETRRKRMHVAEWGCSTVLLAGGGAMLLGCLGLVPGALVSAVTEREWSSVVPAWARVGAVSGAALGFLVGGFLATGGWHANDAAMARRYGEEQRVTHGSGFYMATWSMMVFTLIAGSTAALGLGVAYGTNGILVGLSTGPAVAYMLAGRGVVTYWLTRLLLARANLAPLRLHAFLDHISTTMITHHAGTGYLFHHRLLLEFFAGAELANDSHHVLPGALPTVDLKPRQLLERATIVARSAPSEALSALKFAVQDLAPEEYLPVALEVAKCIDLRRSMDERAFETEQLLATFDIYKLVMESGHPEFAPAAAYHLGELILHARQLPRSRHLPLAVELPSRRVGMSYLRDAAQSAHPIWKERAAGRLEELGQPV